MLTEQKYPKTQAQVDFERECEHAYPRHFDFRRSDLFHGDYHNELTRYTFAGFQLAISPRTRG